MSVQCRAGKWEKSLLAPSGEKYLKEVYGGRLVYRAKGSSKRFTYIKFRKDS